VGWWETRGVWWAKGRDWDWEFCGEEETKENWESDGAGRVERGNGTLHSVVVSSTISASSEDPENMIEREKRKKRRTVMFSTHFLFFQQWFE